MYLLVYMVMSCTASPFVKAVEKKIYDIHRNRPRIIYVRDS